MSTGGYEEDLDPIDGFDLVKGQKRCQKGRHLRKGDALRLQKLSDRSVVVKTLHDPNDTISKKEKRRLQKAGSTGSLDLDVQYSLNKQQRWKTINTQSLLNRQCDSDPESFVVDRVITPGHLGTNNSLNVMNVFVKEGDTITKLSTKGKGHKLRHFEVALRERREIDKKEVEPGRILYNVVKPHPVPSVLLGKTQRKNRRGARTTKSRPTEYLSDGTEHESDSEEDETPISTSAPSSSFTLGDFVKDTEATGTNRHSRRSTTHTLHEEPKKKVSTKVPQTKLQQGSNSKPLFAVVDVDAKLLHGMEFRDAIASLEEERVAVKWVDADRVTIDASHLVRNYPEEPIHQPLLVLFFELHEGAKVLRVRINANVEPKGNQNMEALVHTVKRQQDFVSLFRDLVDFVRKLRLSNLDTPSEVARFTKSPANFDDAVNSCKLAMEKKRVLRCDHYEMLRWLREMYYTTAERVENSPSSCWRCSLHAKDMFESPEGMICRECVASEVVRQISFGRYPVEIPLSPTPTCSSIDLLFAVLPSSTISNLVEASYQHLQTDKVVFSKCPCCALKVMIRVDDNSVEEKSLTCPVCSTHWCRRCSSEPHWPMKCDEYRQWSDKWEQQYFVDKFCMQPDEELLRISCWCDLHHIVPSGTAHNFTCPNRKCRRRYDKTGLMAHIWQYGARYRKIHNKLGKPKDGYPVTVETIPRVKLIAKEYASTCTDARNLRFDERKRRDFEKLAVSANEPELIDLRRTALILVENCTAWMYLHRSELHIGECKSAVSHLFQQITKTQLELERQSTNLNKEVEELKNSIEKVMSTFLQCACSTRREESLDVALLEQECLTFKWVDPVRVRIDASNLVKPVPDEPVRQPLLVLFFELCEDGKVLRVRINTNIQHRTPMDSEALIFMVKRQKDFLSLFNVILDFVRDIRARNRVVPDDDTTRLNSIVDIVRYLHDRDLAIPAISLEETRFTKAPANFKDNVNSRALAMEKKRVQRCDEYEMQDWLTDVYDTGASVSPEMRKSFSSTCCRCMLRMKDMFEAPNGMICRECAAGDIIRQVAYNKFAVDMPVSYQHLRSDEMVFSKCPSCALNVMFRNDDNAEEGKSLICPDCSAHWCRLCSSEPHWPMNCDEYRKWNEKWDKQYFVDKFCMQPDEELLRIFCVCGSILFLPSGTAHNTLCSRCRCRFDKTGAMCYDYINSPFVPIARKMHRAEGRPKEGYKVTVDTVPRVKLIAKEFAITCTVARNQRFASEERRRFEKLALSAGRLELVDLRKTTLFLVENCTAWMYIHRAETHLQKCKSVVSQLLQHFNRIQLELERQSLTLNKQIDWLKSAIENVISIFSERLRSTTEEE
ncbi:hypothetical protein Q1695_003631 [Nippostrongylus brasiliensis]|nr:hypothetical protein Q1695_003631 [Nippostrongylus brasiliensis]